MAREINNLYYFFLRATLCFLCEKLHRATQRKHSVTRSFLQSYDFLQIPNHYMFFILCAYSIVY